MNNEFLKETGVNSERLAMSNAIQAALQHNKTYKDFSTQKQIRTFQTELAKQIRIEAQPYTVTVSDVEHLKAIRRIIDSVSLACGTSLANGRLKYGTAQKAFNLYLKFLWCLGNIARPPHCPIDRIVLTKAGINDAWTKCDSEDQYRGWIARITAKAGDLALSEWEHQVWLSGRRK